MRLSKFFDSRVSDFDTRILNSHLTFLVSAIDCCGCNLIDSYSSVFGFPQFNILRIMHFLQLSFKVSITRIREMVNRCFWSSQTYLCFILAVIRILVFLPEFHKI